MSRRPWYWYVARSNEIFLDLDSKRALNRALNVLRRAILRERTGKGVFSEYPFSFPFQNVLRVHSVWIYPTQSENHYHLIVVGWHDMPVELRLAWALWMGADQVRAAYVMERYRHGFPRPELLCTRSLYGFRIADDACDCRDKHKRKVITEGCPALSRILGNHRSADYFPRNFDKIKRRPLPIQWGKVSKEKLLRWR